MFIFCRQGSVIAEVIAEVLVGVASGGTIGFQEKLKSVIRTGFIGELAVDKEYFMSDKTKGK